MTAKNSRQPLNRERVLAAAIALADADGVQALTMRRLAADLGIEAMSLYFHLPNKEALLDGIVETVVGRIEATGDDLDWRTRLRQQFLAARRVMLQHPWAPGLLTTRRTIPPGVFAYYDRIVGTLMDAGFSARLAHRAIHAFGSLPFGFAQEIFSPASAGGSLAEDVAEEDLAAMAAAVPHITAMVATEVHDAADPSLGWCDSQVEFEFTVDLLLDGLERLRGSRSATRL